ncbi:MAG: RNA polymerase sigma-70 factor [Dermatophilaceae bacterium]|nr:RNA polymerase sigma-70 factor [Dermatophilaceae bacterium]
MSNPQTRSTAGGRHDRFDPHPRRPDHRPQGRRHQAFRQEDAGPGAHLARRLLAQPEGAHGNDVRRGQAAEVGRVRRAAEVLRPHGGRLAGRLQLVPRLQLLRGAQQAPRPGQGPRDPALARVRRVLAARARGAGLRGGDDRDGADGLRRDGGVAGRPARRGGDRRADRRHRVRQPHDPRERRPRHRVRRFRGGVRSQAAGGASGRRVDGVTPSGDPFLDNRGLLFTVAYEMLGSAADAEDVVQETWLRWDALGDEGRADVQHPRAFLVRMVTRKALDRLRSNARRREEYVGAWLPEPLLTAPDLAEDAELAESVSMAMLTVLETLTPTERAVFVLREVFDTPYDEIAAAVGKSPAAVRQIGHRAREHVAARRPRMDVGRREQQEVVERFLAAVTGGELQELLDVLAPDVVLVADGGGVVQAVVNPVVGAKKVANLLRPFGRLAPGARILQVLLNGAVGARIVGTDDGYDTAISFVVEGGRIHRIYAVRNPAKLGQIDVEATISR